MNRTEDARDLIADLGGRLPATEGDWAALGSLITDALLAGDRETLKTLNDGLRSLYGQGRAGLFGRGQEGQSGRLLGLLDITATALLRIRA